MDYGGNPPGRVQTLIAMVDRNRVQSGAKAVSRFAKQATNGRGNARKIFIP